MLFASKSHRDFALNYWRDSEVLEDLTGRYKEEDHAPLTAGERGRPVSTWSLAEEPVDVHYSSSIMTFTL